MADTPVATRNRKNKRAGSDWETTLEREFRMKGYDIERLRLKGAEDEGDLVIREGDGSYLVIEAKTGAFQAGTFIREAELERKHFAQHRQLDDYDVESIVIVKRRGKGWQDAFVLTTVADYFGLED